MFPYTGDYIKHDDKHSFAYYTFIPRPLMNGDMFEMDDELFALLINAHQNIGFLKGLIKYAPNKESFSDLMLMKECAYSRMIDYNSPTFQQVLACQGSGKEDITSITNIEMAYKVATNKTVSAPDLNKLYEIALYGNDTDNTIGIREKQTFWLGVKTNLKAYNPTEPDAVLPALADIFAYLYNDKDTDALIKAALVHYQFEMIHPFEQYNGIVGRIIIPMVLRTTIGEAAPLICLSEYLYYNKNEYFDLLRTTQYSGGYIRWIKFFVNAIGKVAKRSAELLVQYEYVIAKDKNLLIDIGVTSKSIFAVYELLKRFPIISISIAEKEIGFSFNTISKSLACMKKYGIIKQCNNNGRNRIFSYENIVQLLTTR